MLKTKPIVVIRNKDCDVGTWELSKGFEIEHRTLKRLIKKYEEDFNCLGPPITTEWQLPLSKKGGGVVQEHRLNEPQATYLITLLRNNPKVVQFKLALTKEFFEKRKLLAAIAAKKYNQEWLSRRDSGKLDRKLETDAIKDFINYAKEQGSKNADKYYMIISKMENSSLVNIELLQHEFSNLRNTVDLFTLSALQIADVIVATSLREGMKKGLFYKKIYQDAKEKIENLARSIGKTPMNFIPQDSNHKSIPS